VFGKNDTVGAFLDITEDTVTITFTKNGQTQARPRVSGPYSIDIDPNPIRIQGFDDQKLKIKLQLKIFFLHQNYRTIYLSLGFHKGRPSYMRSLQLSKENIQHFKT
jgi:hypothetical protein